MLIKLIVGDADGDFRNVDHYYEVNYPIGRIAEAYKESCRRLGIQFNDHYHDFTGLKPKWNDFDHLVWTESDRYEISENAYRTLLNAGILEEDEVEKEDGGYDYQPDPEDLIMRFIAYSMPKDFTYEWVDEPIPRLNDEIGGNIGYAFTAV